MMKIKAKYLCLSLVLTLAALPVSARAQPDDATVRKDLLTVLALKGKPCREIITLQRQGENDYLVTCKDGSKYRIYIDAQDRVLVEDRK